MDPEQESDLPSVCRKMETADARRSSTKPIDIYNYFIEDCLRELAKVPLESQLRELRPLKTLVLDYCGMISKYLCKFKNCDIYLLDSDDEDACDKATHYEAVYVLVYELQPVFVTFPCIKVICCENRISRTEFSGRTSS